MATWGFQGCYLCRPLFYLWASSNSLWQRSNLTEPSGRRRAWLVCLLQVSDLGNSRLCEMIGWSQFCCECREFHRACSSCVVQVETLTTESEHVLRLLSGSRPSSIKFRMHQWNGDAQTLLAAVRVCRRPHSWDKSPSRTKHNLEEECLTFFYRSSSIL